MMKERIVNQMKISKAKGATTNTYEAEMKGLSACPIKMKFQHVNVNVMFSSDSEGETLSILDPTTKKQIILPFGEIERLAGYVRNARAQG